ncbi:MAG: hypothetical protein LUH04_06875 [Clostridium sp.]|nr:hypothetical protein [Clostridium sp.]
MIETVFSVLGLSTANRPPQAREAVNESLHDSGIAFMLAFNAVPELAEDQGLRIKILSRLQMSGCSKKSRPDPALALLAE